MFLPIVIDKDYYFEIFALCDGNKKGTPESGNVHGILRLEIRQFKSTLKMSISFNNVMESDGHLTWCLLSGL